MKTALDSNILSSLWSAEASAASIKEQLVKARARGNIVVCAAVYAELAAHPRVTIALVDRLLREAGIEVEFILDEPVWRKAAERFAAYARQRRRSAGSTPNRLLVDFLIAAHASLHADRLMTLDPERYQLYFPDLQII